MTDQGGGWPPPGAGAMQKSYSERSDAPVPTGRPSARWFQ